MLAYLFRSVLVSMYYYMPTLDISSKRISIVSDILGTYLTYCISVYLKDT